MIRTLTPLTVSFAVMTAVALGVSPVQAGDYGLSPGYGHSLNGYHTQSYRLVQPEPLCHDEPTISYKPIVSYRTIRVPRTTYVKQYDDCGHLQIVKVVRLETRQIPVTHHVRVYE